MYKFISLIFLGKSFSAIHRDAIQLDNLSLSNSWWEASGCISNIRSLSSSKRRFCSERSSTKSPQQSSSSPASCPSSGSGTEGDTSCEIETSSQSRLEMLSNGSHLLS